MVSELDFFTMSLSILNGFHRFRITFRCSEVIGSNFGSCLGSVHISRDTRRGGQHQCHARGGRGPESAKPVSRDMKSAPNKRNPPKKTVNTFSCVEQTR